MDTDETEEIALVHIHTALYQLGYRLPDCDEMPEPYQRLVWMLAARIQSGVSDDLTEFFESMMLVTRHHMDQQIDHMDDYANGFKQQRDQLRGLDRRVGTPEAEGTETRCSGSRLPVGTDHSPFGGKCAECGTITHTYEADGVTYAAIHQPPA